jgi:hypothetical protein
VIDRRRCDDDLVETVDGRETIGDRTMSEHPLATRSRELFRAVWDDGDFQPFIDSLADDVAWTNDIGAGPMRALHGKDQVIAMQIWWFDFFAGNFRHELIDVCASDQRVIQLLREIGTKDGHVFDNVALYVFEVDPNNHNLYTVVQTLDRDRDNITSFWSHYPDTMATEPVTLLRAFMP